MKNNLDGKFGTISLSFITLTLIGIYLSTHLVNSLFPIRGDPNVITLIGQYTLSIRDTYKAGITQLPPKLWPQKIIDFSTPLNAIWFSFKYF